MATNPPTGPARWVDVLAAAALAGEGIAEIRVGEHPLVLVRQDGALYALAGICPHERARLGGGALDGGVLVCPRHRARFRLADGVCESGFTLPALACYPVRIRAGRIEIDAGEVERHPPLPGTTERWDLTRR